MEKICNEVTAGRMSGPYLLPPMPNLHVSPIGVVPKADGGWRMITHLSYPPSFSINEQIDPQFTTVTYTSFDTVVQTISKLGPMALLAKVDIKNAFRLLPIYPGDFELLGIYINGAYYFDKCLPFGCSISCKIFETFSTFLEWAVKFKTQLDTVHHYLDDFIFIGKSNSDNCSALMHTFQDICSEIGVPLNQDKTIEPTTKLTFLGLEIDTVNMLVQILLVRFKSSNFCCSIGSHRKKILLSQLESLVGKLNFVSKAIPGSRAFNRRFYNVMSGVPSPYHHIRITNPIREDMFTWLQFLDNFNGVVYFPDTEWVTLDTLQLYKDSAGSGHLGCGSFFQGQWVHFTWPSSWLNKPILRDITFLELVPIVLAFMIWGLRLQNKKVILHVDNISLVHILNKQSAKSPRVMVLVRSLVLMALKHNIQFKAQHIPGKSNIIADSISRKQWEVFRAEAPSSAIHSSPIPDITLTSHIQSLFNASVAINTRQTHTTGINSFETFRRSHNLPSLWPPLDTHITRFIAYLSLSGYKYSTAQSYIAAISFYSKAIYNVDHTNPLL